MAVSISYNGSALGTVEGGQRATINCAGKKMGSNVVIDVPPTPSTEFVVGACTLGQIGGSTQFSFHFIVGMDWDLFAQTVGEQIGFNDPATDQYPTIFGMRIYDPAGIPVSWTDTVVDGAAYTYG